MSTFIPAYLKALGVHLTPNVDPDAMVSQLLAGTSKMIENDRPDQTLKEVFENHFYPSLGLQPDGVQSTIDDFYRREFPKLAHLTQPRTSALNFVKRAFERGYRVAIATNPLFPRAAILERLRWAKLPAEVYPFEVITSFETFHFAKPNPAYFAEILAQLGWPGGPIVVVGDDLQNDIHPARCMELATFWVNDEGSPFVENGEVPHSQGGLEDILDWIDHASPESLTPEFERPPALAAIFKSSPAGIQTLADPIPHTMWTQRPRREEWSLTEILCHLRDVELEVFQPRLKLVLTQTNPFLPGQDTDAWAQERGYNQQEGPLALQDFVMARNSTLEILSELTTDAWQREARHTIFGPTDLLELVKIQSGHDRLHIRQLFQTIDQLNR
jgi:FMN phosphatase YigB (HAD superfamily)